MKNNIALIGFMGTGKTVVGKILAERLHKGFIELDTFIEQKAGKSINEIFKAGEIAFREMEIAAVKKVAGKENQVVACGGGVVLNRINIDRLRQNAVLVYLTASQSAILKRTAGDETRPLLNIEDRKARIRELLKFRKPFYKAAADFTIDTSKLSVDEVAAEIIARLKEYADFRF